MISLLSSLFIASAQHAGSGMRPYETTFGVAVCLPDVEINHFLAPADAVCLRTFLQEKTDSVPLRKQNLKHTPPSVLLRHRIRE